MVPAVVIDSSVAVKWILPEAGRQAALDVLDAYEAAKVNLIAPSLLVAEVASVLSKRCRRKLLNQDQAREAFRLFQERCPILTDVSEPAPFALELSLAHGLSLYDCLYLALAIERGCELVTADERLYASASRAYPALRLLRTRP